MTLYVVTYDLHKIRNYQPLYKLLSDMGSNRLLESVWLVYSPLTAAELRDAITNTVDSDDSCAVMEIAENGAWATRNAFPAGSGASALKSRRHQYRQNDFQYQCLICFVVFAKKNASVVKNSNASLNCFGA